MLWHPALSRKAWLDTRGRFVTGLVLLLLSSGAIVYFYEFEIRRLSIEAMARQAQREVIFGDYRTYVWNSGVRETVRQLTALFAVVLAAGGLLSQASRGGGLFMMSLPVTRQQLLWTRTAVGLLELAALALLPMLLLSALSSAMGQRYPMVDALVHALCLFAGGSVLFSATTLLSTVFNDPWRPPLVALCGVIVIGFLVMLLGGSSRGSLLGVMTGESWFRDQQVPTIGLLLSAGASAALLSLARRNLTRLDF